MAQQDLATQVKPSTPSSAFLRVYPDSTTKRWASVDDTGDCVIYPVQYVNASVAAASAAFAADTYLSGSSITIPVAGDWEVAEQYRCRFDMTKTAAGVAAFTVIVRMGTAGTTADTAILTLAFAAGTAAVDSGMIEVIVNFRTVGSGTSAVIAGTMTCAHHLAATGLHSTGASGYGMIFGTSAGFNSTTPTIIGLSVNGGASFSGTCTQVQSELREV